MSETAAAIEGRVDGALERCFTAKARTAARTTATKVVKAAAPRAAVAANAAPRRAARAS
jgi:hypothetical protein